MPRAMESSIVSRKGNVFPLAVVFHYCRMIYWSTRQPQKYGKVVG